jgi:hypothetical protein
MAERFSANAPSPVSSALSSLGELGMPRRTLSLIRVERATS